MLNVDCGYLVAEDLNLSDLKPNLVTSHRKERVTREPIESSRVHWCASKASSGPVERLAVVQPPLKIVT